MVPKIYVHILTPRTCECYLFWEHHIHNLYICFRNTVYYIHNRFIKIYNALCKTEFYICLYKYMYTYIYIFAGFHECLVSNLWFIYSQNKWCIKLFSIFKRTQEIAYNACNKVTQVDENWRFICSCLDMLLARMVILGEDDIGLFPTVRSSN